MLSHFRTYTYYTMALDNYGAMTLGNTAHTTKMNISLLNQSLNTNALYSTAEYVGITFDNITDKDVITFDNQKLKVMYINKSGRFKVVYMSRYNG